VTSGEPFRTVSIKSRAHGFGVCCTAGVISVVACGLSAVACSGSSPRSNAVRDASSSSGGSSGSSGSGSSGMASGGDSGSGAGGQSGGGGGLGRDGSSSGGSAAGGGGSSGVDGGGAGSSQGGAGGQQGVEYRACEIVGGFSRITAYRIERGTTPNCTIVTLSDGMAGCQFGLTSGIWCLTEAATTRDVQACESSMPPTNVVQATGATGGFSVRAPATVDFNLSFQFPSGAGIPQTVRFEATGCGAHCTAGDCRR
jgi:hypothetical protein